MVDAKNLPTIEPGESKKVRPGEWVTSVGHPWGVLGSATSGIVIGLESSPNGSPDSRREFIAVSLHLRPGYSGGPLLDVQGRLIGINTMMNGPDVGIAIPVHVVKRFLHESLTV
jgi:S1-C subfamily serine protease